MMKLSQTIKIRLWTKFYLSFLLTILMAMFLQGFKCSEFSNNGPHLRTEQSTKENGTNLRMLRKDEDCRSGQMDLDMMGFGSMIWLMDMGD